MPHCLQSHGHIAPYSLFSAVRFKQGLILLGLLALVSGLNNDFTAEAAKKSGPDPAAVAAAEAEKQKAAAEAELKKNLDPVNNQLTKLMVKIESRGLLSPDEAGQLAELKYKLMDIMNQYPQNPMLAKPLYQAGVIFSQREEYNDSYELFNYLAQGFPTTPYGAKAKGQIQQLEKRFGAGYFAVEAAAAPPVATAAPASGTTPSATPAAAGAAPATASTAAPPAATTAPKK